MPFTKVFIACPGITGYQGEAELDTSKRISDLYYKGKGHHDMTCVAYVYRLESKAQVQEVMARHIKEEQELKDRHYKELIALRNEHGA